MQCDKISNMDFEGGHRLSQQDELERGMDERLKIALAGAAVGFLGAVGIVFEPSEPYRAFIVVAGMLGGVVLALLICVVVNRSSSLGAALAWGGVMGLLHALVTFFAKGGWVSMDAPFVLPVGVVTGLLLGPLVRWLRSST